MQKDANYAPSEQNLEEDVAQQMYQALAERMQSDGMDVTADEIAQVIADQSITDASKSPEADDKEQEILAKMIEYQAEYDRQNPAYVVRGALLFCNHGSHRRRLNLPRCHGVYALKHPVMFKPDCVVNVNIPSFGVCDSTDNKTGGSVCYKTEDGGTVKGTPCVPIIVGTWDDVHDDTHIGEEGKAALITRSFLVCKYKGLIEILRSGQEDD